MFIHGLTECEKRQVAVYLRAQEYTAFMVIKHAHAAAQCERRGLDVHPTDRQHLELLDETIAHLHGKYRVGPGLTYDEPRTQPMPSEHSNG